MRHRSKRWIFTWIWIWAHLQLIYSDEGNLTQSPNDNSNSKETRSVFYPRMDYDQWKPLGRGDPLKNDPTYDYVPPVLDRVHYWIDPALRKPDPPLPGENQKTEILLLGVSSKKPSTGTLIADSRKDTYDSFLKFVDAPKFNRPHYPPFFTPSFHSKNKPVKTEQRVPYTMLMPPPIVTKKPIPTTTAPSMTTQDITVQTSNLVYQSSSNLGAITDWLSMETSTSSSLQVPESYIQIQFAPPRSNYTNKPLQTANSDVSINYVTPPSLSDEVMHKGQVSDDKLDISNSYVKIGKTEAQVHSTAIDNIPSFFSHVQHPVMTEITQTPLTMQTIQSMQVMQPPPAATSPIYKATTVTNPLVQALAKEKITTEAISEKLEATTAITYSTITTTTLPPPTVTTTTTLTTDPLFKHYKQPMEPLKGPLYLIIQGHSKVKTYGPSKQFHGIRVQETNEITDDKEELQLKHLHSYIRNKNGEGEPGNREGRSGKLQTLKHVIQTGLGSIDFSDIEANRRQDEIKETEVEFGYKVGEDVTSEKYHKGIVEEARKLHILEEA